MIVDDKYLKTKDGMENGSRKFYQVQPYSMCRVMVANTLPTNYRSFFNWDEQTYVYWAVDKYGSDRQDNLEIYWDQKIALQRDAWDVWFVNNTSY